MRTVCIRTRVLAALLRSSSLQNVALCALVCCAWYCCTNVYTTGHDEADERGDQAAPPPYNGFGNEDDLYAMGLSLEPMNKEVNQDEYERFLRGDKKVLLIHKHTQRTQALWLYCSSNSVLIVTANH
jgi:hypothetical protein